MTYTFRVFQLHKVLCQLSSMRPGNVIVLDNAAFVFLFNDFINNYGQGNGHVPLSGHGTIIL